MNRSTQPDIHPDADSLNAFVERVLAEPEHGRVLEHVAGCARCRDIVYLAQQMAEAEAPSVTQVEAGQRSSWLSPLLAHWRVAWIPAAALAAVAGVLIWVHLHSSQPAFDMARVAPPPAVPAPARSSAPTAGVAALAPSEGAAHRLQSDNTARMVGTPRPPAAAIPTPGMRPVQRNAPNQFQVPGNEVRMAPPAQPDLSAPTAIQSEPPLANTQWQPGQQVQMSADRAMSAKSAQAPANPNMIAVHGGVMPATNTGPKPLAAPQQTVAQYEMMPQPVDGLAALRLTKHLKLPSGLNPVSSAAMFHRLLAVDSAGTLFLSGDAGKHWDAVPVQWTGKIMGVSAQPRTLAAPADSPETAAASIAQAPSPQPAGAQSAADQPANIQAPPPVPGVLFRLVNDQHRAWISTDGRTWHEQPQ
jgi:hypothetical protein